MNRLTGRDSKGVYYRHGAESGLHPYADRPPHDCAEAINRLAAYEDSGLPPEQVQELAKAKAEGHISPVKCPCDASEEAQELMNAKADGRMVELPCKVGDIGWQITECFDGDRGCQGNCDECPKKKTVVSFRFISKAHIVRHVEKGDIGKTVFLSREAAEKAIAEGLK